MIAVASFCRYFLSKVSVGLFMSVKVMFLKILRERMLLIGGGRGSRDVKFTIRPAYATKFIKNLFSQ